MLGSCSRYRRIGQPHHKGTKLTRASSRVLSIVAMSGFTGFSCDLISCAKARSDRDGNIAKGGRQKLMKKFGRPAATLSEHHRVRAAEV
jgi:hypothetical protein